MQRDMFPKRAVASVTGIGGLAGATAGMAFRILTGGLLDAFKARGDVTGCYAVLFAICSCLYFVAFAIHHLCAPTLEPFDMRAESSRDWASPADHEVSDLERSKGDQRSG